MCAKIQVRLRETRQTLLEDKYLRVMACDSAQLAKSEISKIKLQIATGCGTRTHFDICFPMCLLIPDLNTVLIFQFST